MSACYRAFTQPKIMAQVVSDPKDTRPLVAHVIYRLGVGGLENGVINLVNRLPAERFRHAIVCLTDDTDFSQRIEREDVSVHAMHKREGQDFGLWWRLYHLFRQLKPTIVHTRNLGTLEAQIPAWLAGVPVRIHGEHGWDVFDPDGTNKKYRLIRRAHRPLVHRYVPLSKELERYLHDAVGVPANTMRRIYNGVDTARFHPGPGSGLPEGFGVDALVIGTVGRMHGVKDQVNLTRAFIELVDRLPEHAAQLRLVLIGDGPLHAVCAEMLDYAGLMGHAWLPGSRDDVPGLLREMDIFVLPSLAEGISNTVLEAMASGRAVIATEVGGNPELIIDDETGTLVPASDPSALADALQSYVRDPELRQLHGQAARRRAEGVFGLDLMLDRYTALYDELLTDRAPHSVKNRAAGMLPCPHPGRGDGNG